MQTSWEALQRMSVELPARRFGEPAAGLTREGPRPMPSGLGRTRRAVQPEPQGETDLCQDVNPGDQPSADQLP